MRPQCHRVQGATNRMTRRHGAKIEHDNKLIKGGIVGVGRIVRLPKHTGLLPNFEWRILLSETGQITPSQFRTRRNMWQPAPTLTGEQYVLYPFLTFCAMPSRPYNATATMATLVGRGLRPPRKHGCVLFVIFVDLWVFLLFCEETCRGGSYAQYLKGIDSAPPRYSGRRESVRRSRPSRVA